MTINLDDMIEIVMCEESVELKELKLADGTIIWIHGQPLYQVTAVTGGSLDHCIIDAPMQQRMNVTFGVTGHTGIFNTGGPKLNNTAKEITISKGQIFIYGYYLELGDQKIPIASELFDSKHYCYIEIDLDKKNIPIGDPNLESYTVNVEQVQIRVSTVPKKGIDGNIRRLLFGITDSSKLLKYVPHNRCMSNGTGELLTLDDVAIGGPSTTINYWFIGSSYIAVNPVVFFKKTLYADDVVYMFDLPEDIEPVDITKEYPLALNRKMGSIKIVKNGDRYGVEFIAGELITNSIALHTPFILIPFKRY